MMLRTQFDTATAVLTHYYRDRHSKVVRTGTLKTATFKTLIAAVLALAIALPLSGLAQVFEAEDALLNGARVDADNDRPFSGRGFANFTAVNDGTIEWQINVPEAAEYQVDWHYQLQSGSRPLALTLNGQVLDSAWDLPANGSWQSWDVATRRLNLLQGLNQLRLSTTGSEGPNIDFLTLHSLQPRSFYEAEDAELVGARVDADADRPFSGRGFVNFLQLSGSSIIWNVTVAAEGDYDLVWQYQLASGSRPLSLQVNGQALSAALTLPANGSWTSWSSATTPVSLNAGANLVQLSTTGSEGPNIDYLRVIPTVKPNTDRIRINFSDAATPPPSGWLSDNGAAFGRRSNGLTYGWRSDATGAPASTAIYARNRAPNPDINVWRETFVHMNHPASNNTFTWEIELSNGDYFVTVQLGDNSNEAEALSEHQLIIEGEADRLAAFARAEGEFGVRNLAISEHAYPVSILDDALTISTVAGSNTKIHLIIIERVAADIATTPFVAGSTPQDGDVDVDPNTTISANFVDGLNPDAGGQTGVEDATVTNNTVALYELAANSSTRVPVLLNTTGGSDAINLTTVAPLKTNTRYRVQMQGVTDTSGEALLPFLAEFITGENAGGTNPKLDQVAFEQVDLGITGRITSLVIGPDNRLYALEFSGEIRRWDINLDGTLSAPLTITTLPDAHPQGLVAVGLVFSPDSTADDITAYVSHATPFNTTDSHPVGDPWGGRISRLSGPLLAETALLITNLPRSSKDHLTNSISIRPEAPRVLYFNQGSNSAAGDADSNWGNRPERLLSAATLRLDLDLLPPALPFNAQTTDDVQRINDDDRSLATFSDGSYNPYAANAPLTLFATGIRNAYDLVWHSNGQLYIPVNGTAGGGTSPAATNTRRPDGSIIEWETPVPRIEKHGVQPDWLIRIDPEAPLKYHGHPNPLRGEYVLNRGHIDSNKISPEIALDPNFSPPVYDFGFNKSPNGVIEYHNTTAHEGNLTGALLVVRYSNNNDIMILVPDPVSGAITSTKVGAPGLTGLNDPLDLVEDRRNGNLYVSDMIHPLDSPGKLLLLRPR